MSPQPKVNLTIKLIIQEVLTLVNIKLLIKIAVL